MFKNKWKLAFWFCFLVLISTTIFSAYCIVDQGVTITHMSEVYQDTENDLIALSIILNETDLSKTEIEKALNKNNLRTFIISKDTIALDRIQLIFDSKHLKKIMYK